MSNHCPFCDSDDLFETSDFTNITNRSGETKMINQEFTRCKKCKEEFVTSQQARNNDHKYFGSGSS